MFSNSRGLGPLNLGLAQVCTKAKVGSSVLKTGPDRPVRLVTFLVRFPLLSRLSIGPVLNRLGRRLNRRLNRRTAWVGQFLENRTVQHHNLYLTKWANLVHSPHGPTLLAYPFFWQNGLDPLLGPTFTAHTHLAEWALYQGLNHKPNNHFGLIAQHELHGKRFIKHFIFPLTFDVG